jgi:hypothetical protein
LAFSVEYSLIHDAPQPLAIRGIDQQSMYRGKFIFVALLAIVSLLGALLLIHPWNRESDRPLATVDEYLRATYARDFAQAYDHLSSADRRQRTRQNFVNSQGVYSGFTLQVARQLAGFMKVWLIEQTDKRDRRVIRVGYRVPAPAELNDLLLNWDQDRLNALSTEKQKEIVAELDSRNQSDKLLHIEGQETLELVAEPEGWKIFLDWAAGTRVVLQSKITDRSKLQVRFAASELVARNDELFLVNLKISNPSAHAVTFTVGHILEPATAADDLQLVECGLLAPTTLDAQQEKEFAMAYQLNTAVGQSRREIKLIYEFTVK